MQQNTWITRSIGVLVAVAASALATSSASADGYQRRGIAPISAGCANFGGFYAGGNIGWASLTAHQNDLDNFTGLGGLLGGGATSFTATDDSFTAGAQVGYNLQKGCTLFGLEADVNWSDLNRDSRAGFPLLAALGENVNDRLGTRIENFGTIRTRTGVVVDQLLLYVTGGFAWADVRDSARDHIAVGPIVLLDEQHSFSDTRWGWTAGFGTEYKLAPNISLTSDVLYLSFADQDHSFTSPLLGLRFNTRTDDQIWVARMGLNISFGDRGAVVAAPLK
jgi:outer membrane immunogenic protein